MVLTIGVESEQPSGGTSLELLHDRRNRARRDQALRRKGLARADDVGVLFIVTLQNGLDLKAVSDDVKQNIIGAVLIAAASTDFLRTRVRRRWLRELAVNMDGNQVQEQVSQQQVAAGGLGRTP